MLHIENLTCRYGKIEAVHNLTLDLDRSQIVALIGSNGAGKSTTIQCIAGHVPCAAGKIVFLDQDISELTPQARVQRGIAVAPEGRRLFRDLTVRENLVMGGYCRSRARKQAIWNACSIFSLVSLNASIPGQNIFRGENSRWSRSDAP